MINGGVETIVGIAHDPLFGPLVAFGIGGTNVDPAKDSHMHSARLWLKGPDALEAEWTAYARGKPAGAHKFLAARVKK